MQAPNMMPQQQVAYGQPWGNPYAPQPQPANPYAQQVAPVADPSELA